MEVIRVIGAGTGFYRISKRSVRNRGRFQPTLRNVLANIERKSATFTPPDDKLAKDYDIQYDIKESWGGNGPIQASWPTFLYPGMSMYFPIAASIFLTGEIEIKVDAWRGVPGVEFPKDGSAGEPGVIWVPTSQDPKNVTRSYARTGHYDPVKTRPNYSILTRHKGAKIEFSSAPGPLTAESVVIVPRSGDEKKTKVAARKEIIIAGGTIHSPQILQTSGVGPRALLESANISVVHELPGVGQNFHDHSWFTISYNCKQLQINHLENKIFC
jgi:choline dehydrogenase